MSRSVSRFAARLRVECGAGMRGATRGYEGEKNMAVPLLIAGRRRQSTMAKDAYRAADLKVIELN